MRLLRHHIIKLHCYHTVCSLPSSYKERVKFRKRRNSTQKQRENTLDMKGKIPKLPSFKSYNGWVCMHVCVYFQCIASLTGNVKLQNKITVSIHYRCVFVHIKKRKQLNGMNLPQTDMYKRTHNVNIYDYGTMLRYPIKFRLLKYICKYMMNA